MVCPHRCFIGFCPLRSGGCKRHNPRGSCTVWQPQRATRYCRNHRDIRPHGASPTAAGRRPVGDAQLSPRRRAAAHGAAAAVHLDQEARGRTRRAPVRPALHRPAAHGRRRSRAAERQARAVLRRRGPPRGPRRRGGRRGPAAHRLRRLGHLFADAADRAQLSPPVPARGPGDRGVDHHRSAAAHRRPLARPRAGALPGADADGRGTHGAAAGPPGAGRERRFGLRAAQRDRHRRAGGRALHRVLAHAGAHHACADHAGVPGCRRAAAHHAGGGAGPDDPRPGGKRPGHGAGAGGGAALRQQRRAPDPADQHAVQIHRGHRDGHAARRLDAGRTQFHRGGACCCPAFCNAATGSVFVADVGGLHDAPGLLDLGPLELAEGLRRAVEHRPALQGDEGPGLVAVHQLLDGLRRPGEHGLGHARGKEHAGPGIRLTPCTLR
eukprot:Opistho-1_new@68404